MFRNHWENLKKLIRACYVSFCLWLYHCNSKMMYDVWSIGWVAINNKQWWTDLPRSLMSFPCRIALTGLLKIVILCSSKQSWFRLWVAVIHFKFFKVYRLFPVCSKNVNYIYYTYISPSDAFPTPTIIIKLYCKMGHCSQFDIDVYELEAARCKCSYQILLLSDSHLLLTLKVLEVN